MTDVSRIKEWQVAYLCLKDTLADDLGSYSDLKHALQYAGFNPTSTMLQQWWPEGITEKVTFQSFCRICEEFQSVSEDDINNIILNHFPIENNKVSVTELKTLLLLSKADSVLTDIDLIIEEFGVEDGLVNVSNICHCILETISTLKKFSQTAFEEKNLPNHDKRRKGTLISEILKIDEMSITESVPDTNSWNIATLKGSFFLDNDCIISHQFAFEITTSSDVLIKISPTQLRSTMATVDALAYIFRETTDGVRNYLGYTNLNSNGSNYLKQTLNEGKYIIIPYASGGNLRKVNNISHSQSRNEIKLINSDEKIQLTEDCINILGEIFLQMDLDNNGVLNRQEFNLYNWRTSAEIVQDDEWEVVQKNFEVVNGELTLDGFISLHQLEAEDNVGDSEDLWLSLQTIGYNRYGEQDQAVPFLLEVYSQTTRPSLIVSGLKSGGLLMDKALVKSVMEESEPEAICERSELVKYMYNGNQRAAIVIQNKSDKNIRLSVDCSKSINCMSNRKNLIWEGDIDRKSVVIAHQLIPKLLSHPWKIISNECIL